MRGERALAFVSDHVWALLQSKLEQMLVVIEANLVGPPISEETIKAYSAAAQERPTSRSAGAVAVIPVYGLITQRMNMMTAMSGGTSTQMLSKVFGEVMANENVSAVVFDLASPGGSVQGLEEFAAEVAASKGKPVIACVNAQAGSGAFWIATQCDQIICTPSGEVGGVGCIGFHTDLSKMAEMEGVKKTFIVSSVSPLKAEGNEYEKLGDEAYAHAKSRVDAYGDTFARAVARGRGTTVQAVRENYGQGRMYGAQEALKRGMIDGILPLEEVVARLAAGRKRVVGGNSAEDGSGRVFAGPGVQIINAEDVRPPREDPPPTASDVPAVSSPAKVDDGEPIAPDDDGSCPEGYEKGEDGMCYPVEEVKGKAKAGVEVPTATDEAPKSEEVASAVTVPAGVADDLDLRRRRNRHAQASRR